MTTIVTPLKPTGIGPVEYIRVGLADAQLMEVRGAIDTLRALRPGSAAIADLGGSISRH